MNHSLPEQEEAEQKRQWFAATHWSVVVATNDASPQQRAKALETLCRTYWEPLYAFLRSLGHDRFDAQDLTQGFFAHLLARNPFPGLTPEKGRFRSFLLKSLQHFLADQHARDAASKRGGGKALLPLDPEMAEKRYAEEATTQASSGMAFDRLWAVTVMNRAFAALERDYVTAGKGEQFVELSVFLGAEGTAEDYAAAADKLRMTNNAVAVAVHRLRARYRACIYSHVAQTVAEPGEVEEEMRYLLELVCQ